MNEDEYAIWNKLIDLRMCYEWKGTLKPTTVGYLMVRLIEQSKMSFKHQKILFRIVRELRHFDFGNRIEKYE